jgi:hypothetical protein
MKDINGYFFRSLDDIREIEDIKSKIYSGADGPALRSKSSGVADAKSGLFIRALKAAYDRRDK